MQAVPKKRLCPFGHSGHGRLGAVEQAGAPVGRPRHAADAVIVLFLLLVSARALLWRACRRATLARRGALLFKNYVPSDASLAPPAASSVAPLASSLSKEPTPASSLRAQIAAIEESDKSLPSERPVTLAPKKDTWDLKREMGKKLKALDRLTDAAIRDVLREKVKSRA